MMSAREKLDYTWSPGKASGLELKYPERLVEPSAWLGHVPFAMWLVGALNPRMVVELGVHTGNSYCAFLQAVQQLGLDTRCFGIDHWRGDMHAGHYGEEIYHEFRAYHDARYVTFSALLRSSFDDALSYFSDGSIDLLHIDGLHTYEAVAADFSRWLPKVSSRGVVLFHDINVRERGFGIWQFWEEICSRYPHFQFIHSHGLGVAYLGSEPLTGPLKVLFAAESDAEGERVRSYFARLGTSVTERRAMQTLTAELDAGKARVTALEAELAAARLDAGAFAAAQEQKREQVVAQERATGQIAKLQAELHAARCEAAQANLNAEAFASELSTTKATNETLARQLAAKLHIVTLQSQIQKSLARQQIATTGRLRRDLLATNNDKCSYQRQLQQVLQSKSWRLTGPLRQVVIKLSHLLASGRQS
jgi:hypothetical protein